MPVTKFVRVAVEGATTDGRVIERQWLQDIVDTYNTAKFGARIWLEHLRGILPDSNFKAYGDVLEVKTEEIDFDGGKRLALFAKLDATPELVSMNKARQKIYTSIEISPNFAKTGKAYLTGLGVTDDPASLGTEALSFASTAKSNPFNNRKQDKDNLISEAIEVALEFDADEPTENIGTVLLTKVKDLLGINTKSADANFTAVSDAVTVIAESQKDLLDKFNKDFTKVSNDLTQALADLQKITTDFNTLKTQLETEEQPTEKRKHAAGNGNVEKTDC